jgi:hypothetical protein
MLEQLATKRVATAHPKRNEIGLQDCDQELLAEMLYLKGDNGPY